MSFTLLRSDKPSTIRRSREELYRAYRDRSHSSAIHDLAGKCRTSDRKFQGQRAIYDESRDILNDIPSLTEKELIISADQFVHWLVPLKEFRGYHQLPLLCCQPLCLPNF